MYDSDSELGGMIAAGLIPFIVVIIIMVLLLRQSLDRQQSEAGTNAVEINQLKGGEII